MLFFCTVFEEPSCPDVEVTLFEEPICAAVPTIVFEDEELKNSQSVPPRPEG